MNDQLKEEDRLVCLLMYAGWFLSPYSSLFLLFYCLALFIPLCVYCVETCFHLQIKQKAVLSYFLKHYFPPWDYPNLQSVYKRGTSSLEMAFCLLLPSLQVKLGYVPLGLFVATGLRDFCHITWWVGMERGNSCFSKSVFTTSCGKHSWGISGCICGEGWRRD